MHRVQIPEALIDEIKDLWVKLQRFLVILDQLKDGAAHEIRQKFSHVWIVVTFHCATHCVQFQRLSQARQEFLKSCIATHRELFSLQLLVNVGVNEVLHDLWVDDLTRYLRLLSLTLAGGLLGFGASRFLRRLRLGSIAATSSSLNWSVELRVVLSDTVEHDHKLTEPATKSRDNWLAILGPAVDFSDLLLEDLFDGRRLIYILLFDLLAKSSNLFSLLLCCLLILLAQPLGNLVLLCFLLSCSSIFDLICVCLHCLRVYIRLLSHEVTNERVGVRVMGAHLLDKFLCLCHQPWHDISFHNILSEAILEVTHVTKVSERTHFHVAHE